MAAIVVSLRASLQNMHHEELQSILIIPTCHIFAGVWFGKFVKKILLNKNFFFIVVFFSLCLLSFMLNRNIKTKILKLRNKIFYKTCCLKKKVIIFSIKICLKTFIPKFSYNILVTFLKIKFLFIQTNILAKTFSKKIF